MDVAHAPVISRRSLVLVFALALGVGTILAILVEQPGYMDAYYYYNAAHRLVSGDGLTDPYVWHYLDAPDALPAPSHTYWMPLQSLLAAGAMALGGATFGAAQVPSVLCYAGLVTFAFWLGVILGGTRRIAWIGALLVLCSGFFTPFWTTTDTFAAFGLAGALAIAASGLGRARRAGKWFLVAGALAGLAHLARADGALLVAVAGLLAVWPDDRSTWRDRITHALLAAIGYFVLMGPWLARNVSVMGAPLSTAGTATIWLRGYDELVRYPPTASFDNFLSWGVGNILGSRWEALTNNLGTFVAVETWVVLAPFALVGLWRLRRNPLAQSAALYAIGLHVAMTLVFAYPGYRGGLFHSSAALLPYWAVCGTIGLDRAVEALGRRRRWRVRQAQVVFGGALVVIAALLSIYTLAARLPSLNRNAVVYHQLAEFLPPDATVILNDPPALYYHTGLSGVVLPDSPPENVLDLAERYGATHVVLDRDRTAPFAALYQGEASVPFLRLEHVIGQETEDEGDDLQVYAIVPQEAPAP